ncbi:bifunctional nuclease domain-containing protein [Ferruginibacter sp. SUN106]|uniref:bifunctional nuclease family protein n=1 Tax=Ferruginibacter sp. SUN106 TaxID=2978348 RepID=UPI003D35AC57
MEDIEKHFSDETRQLIGASREIALQTGFDYISSIHFMLADCAAGLTGSFNNFFDDQSVLKKLKESYRVKKIWGSGKKQDVVPLSAELAKAIRRSLSLYLHYGANAIRPAHIFLAAIQDNESEIAKYFAGVPYCDMKMMAYYSAIGELKESEVPKEKENDFGALQYDKIQLEFKSVSESATQQHTVAIILGTLTDKRKLPIVALRKELQHFYEVVEKIVLDRPKVHNILYSTITATQYHVEEVHINKLLHDVFHAKIVIGNGVQQFILDARPSDALTLALIAKAPIYTSAAVLGAAGIEMD